MDLLWPVVLAIIIFILSGCLTEANNGDWIQCPTNVTTHTGCPLTINALYETTNTSLSCSEDFIYYIFLNGNKSQTLITTNSVNDNSNNNNNNNSYNNNNTICNVSATLTVFAGLHNVTFSAQHTTNPTIINDCYNNIQVIDNIPSPHFTNISVSCNGVLFEWILGRPPALLNEYYYSLQINNTVYHTTNTSILIEYNKGIEFHQQYNISIYATLCGINSDTTNDSFYTALAPQIDNDNTINIYKHNDTHSALIYNTKVANNECVVAYPNTVNINITCSRYTTLLYTQPVIVDNNGTFRIKLFVPVDTMCSIQLKFTNYQLTASADDIINFNDINTNQLQSCRVWTNTGDFMITCEFSSGSSLNGCRVIAIDETNKLNNYTIDIDSSGDEHYGQITNVREALYTVYCYGITNNSRVIDYNYSQLINVTTAIFDFDALSPNYNTDVITPSIILIYVETSNSSTVVIIYCVVFVIVLILSITTTVSITICIDNKNRYCSFNIKRHHTNNDGSAVLSVNFEETVLIEMEDRPVYNKPIKDRYSDHQTVQSSIKNVVSSKVQKEDSHRPLIEEDSSSEAMSATESPSP